MPRHSFPPPPPPLQVKLTEELHRDELKAARKEAEEMQKKVRSRPAVHSKCSSVQQLDWPEQAGRLSLRCCVWVLGCRDSVAAPQAAPRMDGSRTSLPFFASSLGSRLLDWQSCLASPTP
jgi:hypothetical protein